MHASLVLTSRPVDTTQTWPAYFRRVTGGLAPSDISKRSGIPLSTITRWLSGETRPSVAKIQELARVFPMQLDEAQAAASATVTVSRELKGQIVQVGNTQHSRHRLLRKYSDLELASEIVRRIEEHDSVEIPLPFSTDEAPNVTAIRSNVPNPQETPLRGVAKKKSRDRGGDDGQG